MRVPAWIKTNDDDDDDEDDGDIDDDDDNYTMMMIWYQPHSPNVLPRQIW